MASNDDLGTAFRAHKEGQTKFTRRMAVNIADFFEMTPMAVVWRLERAGYLKKGSWLWFKHNGGITKENIAEARADRAAEPERKKL
ncbi:MAG TPA: hypothetical protein VM659_28845 [Dongiaceae bacterium]|nr:hypothetical protein [Dongiaceae bacterium]